MLPKRIPKQAKRASRWRSQAHANFVRSHGCCMPGCVGMPIEFAHVRLGSHTGMGQKPDDWRGVSLCKFHHNEQHVLGEGSFWGFVKAQGGTDAETLINEFINASPKRLDILRTMRERHDANR